VTYSAITARILAREPTAAKTRYSSVKAVRIFRKKQQHRGQHSRHLLLLLRRRHVCYQARQSCMFAQRRFPKG
jgi:hypothetical protein